MIYKCKNCGLEYTEYIEYCDCGNNKFVCIAEAENNTDELQSDSFSFDNVELPKDVEYNLDVKENLSNDESYNDDVSSTSFIENRNFQNLLIFLIVICTISLSCFILYKAITTKSIVKANNNTSTVKSVPSIDEYWDNSVDQVSSAVKNITKPLNKANSTKNINNIKQYAETSKTNINNTNSVLPKAAKQNKTNSTIIQKQQLEKNKNIANSPKQNLKNQKVENKPKIDLNKTETAKNNTNSAIEVDRFKVAVRQSLFSKFPILQVQGQGSAIIAFSVAENGKLLNRRFVKQSGNLTLDNAVYHMLMQTPFVLSPPNSYSGEEFKIQIDFNNGQYAFSYK